MFPKLLKLSILFILLLAGYNTASASFTVSRPPTLNAGLVGYWTFDGADTNFTTNTVTDKSGQGNNGTMTNMSTTTARAPGKIGQALRFDGVDDYISTGINIGTADKKTFAGWYKFSDLGAGWKVLVLEENTFDAVKYVGITTDGTGSENRIELRQSYNGGASVFGVSYVLNPLNLNQWYHVVGVIDKENGFLKLYIDGVLVNTYSNSSVTSSTFYDPGGSVNVGGGPGGYEFKGLIDEVRIYNRALSASEVKSLYNQSASKFNKTPVNTLTNGLVGYWTFDGADTNFTTNTVADKSGNGNTGTMINMSTSTARTPGKIGQALKFDGVNDRVKVQQSSSINVNDATTFSLWIKALPQLQDPWANFMQKGTGSNGSGSLFLGVNSNTANIHIRVDTPTDFNHNGTIDNILDGQWHYVAVTFNEGNVKMYKDGQQTGSFTYIHGSGFGNTSDFFIGSAYGSQDFLLGTIDEVRIYNRALSASEVKSLYNQSASKFNKTPTGTLTNGLVGYWTFDGADTNFTTNTVVDKSGNGNTGTMINMSTSTARTPGKIGQALRFDGVDDRVNIGDPASGILDFGTNSFSYGMWVYVKETAGNYDMSWIKGGSNASSPGYDFELGAGGWTINIADGTSLKTSSQLGSGVLNQWVHIMAVVDRNSQRLIAYKNGVKVGVDTDLTGFGSVSNSELASIGMRSDNNYPFKGIIDEVRVYNRVLSASEVKTLYNMGR